MPGTILVEALNQDWKGRALRAEKRIDRLRQNAEAFLTAVIESGALANVPQSLYSEQLLALEAALANSQ